MYIELVTLTNFRCFGAQGTKLSLDSSLTALVGANGSGKTAVMQCLQRLFGMTAEQRRLRRRDFHVPANEKAVPPLRELSLEAILVFPELDSGTETTAVPEFFQQMAADDKGKLKVRLRLEATWVDDGTAEGAIEETYIAVRSLGDYTPADCVNLKGADRSRIQLLYIPATRDGASQVSALLKGRLWKAIQWSGKVKTALDGAGAALNTVFREEPAVLRIEEKVKQRWQALHDAGTDAVPVFRPVDTRWQEFIGQVDVTFQPGDDGRDRDINELSDGQKSLFHLALTAATLDAEAEAAKGDAAHGFVPGSISIPALTLIALEEPENTLAPFYLSRILAQVEELVGTAQAQAVISSHSASILSRVKPEAVRHFRLTEDRTARIRAVEMPAELEDASKYLREAVRNYPELYFAKFVVLGEGATEEVVIPRLSKAMGVEIDRSFVAVVPLGGRHVNHMWKLLKTLDIPHATLLDLDWGRQGGAWGRVKIALRQLFANGTPPTTFFKDVTADDPLAEKNLATLDAKNDQAELEIWLAALKEHNVFFSAPLDLDYSMLEAYFDAYTVLEEGMNGPKAGLDARDAVLGDGGSPGAYGPEHDEALRWYRYLFLGRGKPSTHVRALSKLKDEKLIEAMPPFLKELIEVMRKSL
ncbi:ATP-dependent nuclease [Paucibacter sp. M5-1]|uniref:ATP-dependent nuclease n=1 Tax=Paucibacter sp. M5-1 TaxID=3015998 RepID=UPI0022B93025|nr:AAA family ATPase [Paucibacter sp. M5-1]MCZ7884623.1 AAA family ATPase [Paucibacter sp. M5-1]